MGFSMRGETMSDKKTVLICDDNEDILDVVSVIMSKAGYEVKGANSYKELLPLLDSTGASILICDIRMPERDGFWIAEHMQAKNIRIPIIFMTAYDSNLYRTYAPFVGSVGFVTKPIDSGELLRQVEKALAPKPETAPERPAAEFVPLPR